MGKIMMSPWRASGLAVVVLSVLAVSHAKAHAEDVAQRFKAAGLGDGEASAFLSELKARVEKGDRQRVCELVQFPIKVRIKGVEKRIGSVADCVKRFDGIFTEKVVKAVREQMVEKLFASWRGVMIGDGEVWFSGICSDNTCAKRRIRIIAVNS